MAAECKISVRFISGAYKDTANFDAGIYESITYVVKAVAVKMAK